MHLLLFIVFSILCPKHKTITVAADGSGNYKTIQEAINAVDIADSILQMQRIIYIKNGVYNEKIMLEKQHFITLKGQSEKSVVITFSLARDVWRCEHANDFGAATVNVLAHDLIFENLTIINSYGLEAKEDIEIDCKNESGNVNGADRYALPREKCEPAGKKKVRKDGHQFAFRSFAGATRLAFKNCTFNGGGDTVSPWDVAGGLYYFKNCTMEGQVDFYCPRGWSLAENCKFICHNNNAAIWHDGTEAESSKTVFKNCQFIGDEGFKLGRYHRPAQFYLLGCTFDKNMADAPIYHVSSSPDPKWGHRVFFNNCHRKGQDYAWHIDNTKITTKNITMEWIYDGKWNPSKK
jgi:pectinesterase